MTPGDSCIPLSVQLSPFINHMYFHKSSLADVCWSLLPPYISSSVSECLSEQSHSTDEQQLWEVSGGPLFLSSSLKDHAAVFASFSSFLKGCSNAFSCGCVPHPNQEDVICCTDCKAVWFYPRLRFSVTTLKNDCDEMEFYLWGSKHWKRKHPLMFP